MHDVVAAKVHGSVACGVRWAKMRKIDALTVEVQRHCCVEREAR